MDQPQGEEERQAENMEAMMSMMTAMMQHMQKITELQIKAAEHRAEKGSGGVVGQIGMSSGTTSHEVDSRM